MQTYLPSMQADFSCQFLSCRFAWSHVSQCLCADECRFFCGGGRWRGGSAPVMSSPVRSLYNRAFVCLIIFSHSFNQLRVMKRSLEAQCLLVQGPAERRFANIMVGHLLLCLRSLQQSVFCLQLFGDRLPVTRTSVPVTLEGPPCTDLSSLSQFWKNISCAA